MAKVGTLGLQSFRRNPSGAAKKRARKGRHAEATTRDSDNYSSQPPRNIQSQTLQKPGTSGTQN